MSTAGHAIGEPLQTSPALRTWTAFGLCAGILAAVAVSASILGRGSFLDKDPVPLHKPLDRMDKMRLGPYQLSRHQPLPMPDEIVEALGTREYLQWSLEDPRRPQDDPLRYAMLFVTYYTGGKTQVPHTPERCYLGADWSTRQTWDIEFAIPGLDGSSEVNVPARVLLFNKAGLLDMEERTVVYTFYANCGFACSSNEIRLWLNRPGVAKSFFSKVEVSFSGSELGISNPDPQKAAAAAQELLQTILPVLMRDHWPRPEELTRASAPSAR